MEITATGQFKNVKNTHAVDERKNSPPRVKTADVKLAGEIMIPWSFLPVSRMTSAHDHEKIYKAKFGGGLMLRV